MTRIEPDYAAVAREFLRAVRGRRSQVAFSRRLGFVSNVAAEWESGRRIPLALTALRACQRAGLDVALHLRAFRPSTAEALRRLDEPSLAVWLDAQRGQEGLAAIAERAGLSRHQVSRFFSGGSAPRLHQFFALVHACSGRLSDLVASLVEIEAIPSLRGEHARAATLRRLALVEPWTSAISSALECLSQLEARAARAVLARMFGLELDEVDRYLAEMEGARVIRREQGRYLLGEPLVVDTGSASDANRRLARHWAEVAAERAGAPRRTDVFSYNVFSVSRADLVRIAALQREHFQKVRAIIANSPSETLAVMNLQLLEFDPQLASAP
jgi:transcriptional regulator with XRE-family HTH domain